MNSTIAYVSGADLPAQTTLAARLRHLKRQAKASENILRLLSDLQFGPDPNAGWISPLQPNFTEARAHG